MNHITENALVAGTLLAVFIIPVVIITRRSKQKRFAALNQRLQAIANEHQLSISRSEFIGNKIIGWAQSGKALLFGSQETVTVNDLNNAARCYVLKSMNGTAVKSIILQIADQANRQLCSIPFYQQFIDNELKLKQLETQAKDWEALLNSQFQK
ncbi:hypothetical protein [Mucilaginibacter sp. OK283]|jgi:hypothetical protein|uniref:hypothetical protein n=1 Tax=Mucilaginibacter sp. OK283 TaxID=1881049 RepID=UPI0008D875A3|nr:hypothetical protein [Mucilaginibacter sp. OK283]SEP14374.1 hypothetical protein SAMN05428947_107166 [Mucilaginibacter sp. OK283]